MPIGLASAVGVNSWSFLPYARGAWASGPSAAPASAGGVVAGGVPAASFELGVEVGVGVGTGGLSANLR